MVGYCGRFNFYNKDGKLVKKLYNKPNLTEGYNLKTNPALEVI
jgi:hypothetical protein